MNISQNISYFFPIFRKRQKKKLCFNRFNYNKHIFFTVWATVSSKILVDIFKHLTVGKKYYKVWKEHKKQEAQKS